MKLNCARFAGVVAGCLMVAVSGSSVAGATPKALDPVTVHGRIVKRGLDHFVCVREDNGILLAGRILSIGAQSFSMQVLHDSHPTEVYYADVTEVRGGISRGSVIGMSVFAAAAVGGSVAVAVHSGNSQPKLPPLPSFPPFPAAH